MIGENTPLETQSRRFSDTRFRVIDGAQLAGKSDLTECNDVLADADILEAADKGKADTADQGKADTVALCREQVEALLPLCEESFFTPGGEVLYPFR